MPEHAFTNRLIYETSPYLQQHAHNPVNWYPWAEEAFKAAQDQNKPIFLSIGYATCHWCHRMEKETFEDPQIAALMNEAFINIKVDREELPEVDALYMECAQQMLDGRGGWPLNLILTPQLKPIFAATYIPSSQDHLSLRQLIKDVTQLWNNEEREELLEQADEIVELLEEEEPSEEEELPDEELVLAMAELYLRIADPVNGGIQGAPKFPIGYHINFMLRFGLTHADSRAPFYVQKTLDKMEQGGIYDQLGGGFSRYSVDQFWLVPHFEKMLYDNALLANAYCEGWQMTKNIAYRAVLDEIFNYILRDMTDPQGGFYSAEDADSEGKEGLFYTWTVEEIHRVLGEVEGGLFCSFYGVTLEGNFEGRNVLHQEMSVEEFARFHDKDPLQLAALLASQRQQLWLARKERPRPFKDDKVIVAWNGLMMRSFAQAAFTFGDHHFLIAAVKCAEFIRETLWKEGHLLRCWRQGIAKRPGCLEDYAFLISGLLSLFKAEGGSHWLSWAMELSNVLSAEFKSKGGAFYRSDGRDPHLIVRQVEFYDGAEPSGNAVHCENLLRLYQITHAERYLAEAEDILRAGLAFIEEHPLGGTYYCLALQRYLDQRQPVAVVALNSQQQWRQEIATALGAKYSPHIEVIWFKEDDLQLPTLIPSLREQKPINGQTTLYLCKEGLCLPPLQDVKEIFDAIKAL